MWLCNSITEQPTKEPKIEASNTVTSTMREKIRNKKEQWWLCSRITVVEQPTNKPKIEPSNTVTSTTREKMTNKKEK
jgi:hypothetical protein